VEEVTEVVRERQFPYQRRRGKRNHTVIVDQKRSKKREYKSGLSDGKENSGEDGRRGGESKTSLGRK